MEWYYILFFSVLVFFILKTILSLAFGDTDVDFDADGDVDFDISSMLSFKGILHFMLGFSTYLAATAKFDRTYDGIGTYQFTWDNYVIASIIGLAFMYGLWHLYKLMMKFNHSNENNPDFVGCKCNILTNLGNGRYVVLIKTPLGTFKETMYHIYNKSDIAIGTSMKVMKTINDKRYVIV